MAKEYKLHYKKVSMWPRSTNYTTRRRVSGHGQAVQATPQVGVFQDKEYKLLHDGWVLVLALEEGVASFRPFSYTLYYTGCRLIKSSLLFRVFIFTVILYNFGTFTGLRFTNCFSAN